MPSRSYPATRNPKVAGEVPLKLFRQSVDLRSVPSSSNALCRARYRTSPDDSTPAMPDKVKMVMKTSPDSIFGIRRAPRMRTQPSRLASAPTKRLRVLASCGRASLIGAFLHDEMLAGPSSLARLEAALTGLEITWAKGEEMAEEREALLLEIANCKIARHVLETSDQHCACSKIVATQGAPDWNGYFGKNANRGQIMERRFGRPRPCQRNIKQIVARPRTCCVCPTLIIPRLPFCKASVRLPPSEPTRSRSTTSLTGTVPNRLWHLAEPSFFDIAMNWRPDVWLRQR